jgi:hypothetical protein
MKQRLTIAKVAGDAGDAVAAFFRQLADSAADSSTGLDSFCMGLRVNSSTPPVIYFCEWIDHWLMGDQVFGSTPCDRDGSQSVLSIRGSRFEACCLTPTEAVNWATKLAKQWPEQSWLATRLREAAQAWDLIAPHALVILAREPLGPSTLDEEVVSSLRQIPSWLGKLVEMSEPQ